MINWLLKYYPLVIVLCNLIFGLIVWALHKTYAKHEKVEQLEKEVLLIKNDVSNLPENQDIHTVELQLKELKGEFDGVKKLLGRVSNQLDMLVENELKGSK